MKSARRDIDESAERGTLEPWEALVVDAVGDVIEFWQFKRNQGRVWALLYLRGKALTAGEIQSALGLSKGAVSMLVGELEQWRVLKRARVRGGDDVQRYVAEIDLMQMLGRVISEREVTLVKNVRSDLERAEQLMKESAGVPPDVRDRLKRMKSLATIVDRALRTFLSTARLDMLAALYVLGRRDAPKDP
jgi:DNA-binding transcriptional regulator GbsR (MarR family)